MVMEIDKVINALFHKKSDMIVKGDEPNLAIYMDYEYYSICKAELKGRLSIAQLEFSMDCTIFECPVYKVIPSYTDKGEIKHPPFKILAIG